MTEKKNESKIEREYIVPLRNKCRPVPRYKKTPKAVKSLKEFIARHMKIENRDLNKVKIDSYLNELLWARGIKKPLHKVKVKAIKEGDIVRVYALDLTAKIKFKKERLEKREKEGELAAEKKKSMMEKAKEQLKGKEKEENKDKTEEKKEEKEISKEEVKSGVDKKIAKEESKLDIKESKKTDSKKEEKKE